MSNMRDLVATAMGWLVKTESPDCTPQQRREFEQWLGEDVRHRVAFTIATKSRERIDRLSSLRPLDGRVDPDLLLSPEYTPRSIRRQRVAEPEPPPVNRGSGKLRVLAFAALGVAGICGLYFAGWYANSQLNWETYSTHVGGKETTPLPDGTTVTLNTDSELRVRMTPDARELKLTRGEAVFKAAADENRPFKLMAGKTVIQTAGADFDLRKRDSGQVDVIVSAGRVAAQTVESTLPFPFFDQATPAQSVIAAGYEAAIRPGDIQVSPLNSDERARKTAWLHDVLDFRGETLVEAAEEFNRYNLRKIVIVDRTIANRRVGGVFSNTDPESFVLALAVTMNIRATTVGGEQGPGYGEIRLSSATAQTRR
jgi:transmembrane sensor